MIDVATVRSPAGPIMPSRILVLGITIFWLAATAWFVTRDLLPHWSAGRAPPYSIDLSDEAVRQFVQWRIERDGVSIGTLTTLLRAIEGTDIYELSAECRELPLIESTIPVLGRLLISARHYDDRIRVSRDGELRSMATTLDLAVQLGGGAEIIVHAEISAEVNGGKLDRRFHLSAPGWGDFEPALEPTEPIRGNILNPLNPIHRLQGIRPGQRWRQSVIAPQEEIIRAALTKLPGAGPAVLAFGSAEPRALDATVRAAPEFLETDHGSVECLVIDYRGEWNGVEQSAQTWVRRDDGLVMRQQAMTAGRVLVLTREY
jgi:hypothetical protein